MLRPTIPSTPLRTLSRKIHFFSLAIDDEQPVIQLIVRPAWEFGVEFVHNRDGNPTGPFKTVFRTSCSNAPRLGANGESVQAVPFGVLELA